MPNPNKTMEYENEDLEQFKYAQNEIDSSHFERSTSVESSTYVLLSLEIKKA